MSSTFYSADYKMRLDFSAGYDIKCSELEDQSAYDVLVASAQLPSVIDELCSGGKKPPTAKDPDSYYRYIDFLPTQYNSSILSITD